MATALSFSVPVDSLGSYIADALSSMSSYILIPAGLIIGSAILMFGFKLLKQMKKSINCVPDKVDNAFDRKLKQHWFKCKVAEMKERNEGIKRDMLMPAKQFEDKWTEYTMDRMHSGDFQPGVIRDEDFAKHFPETREARARVMNE